jgi:putative ABC transport system permease protein
MSIPTPSGPASFKIAATTTNFGWIPGAIVMGRRDYARLWESSAPSALGVLLKPGADARSVQHLITQTLGAGSGLEVLTTARRRAAINHSANEGLAQLRDISALLVVAAILAMAAALISSLWQRRVTLAELRLEGAPSRQIRRVLLAESSLLLTAGCLTGAVTGILGQVAIDGYLKHVTGFPVASPTTGFRPAEIFALVLASVLLAVALPGWRASRVPPSLALNE